MAAGKPPSNVGCVLALLALPFVVLAGVVIGTVLRNDDDPAEEQHVTLDEGEIDGTAWRVDAVRDVDGASCVFTFLDGQQSTGACSLDPQDETIGDQTIVFGRAATGHARVTVQLEDGEVVEVDTVTADGIDGRFYVKVIEGDVDAVALA